jgi:hypothetical protein
MRFVEAELDQVRATMPSPWPPNPTHSHSDQTTRYDVCVRPLRRDGNAGRPERGAGAGVVECAPAGAGDVTGRSDNQETMKAGPPGENTRRNGLAVVAAQRRMVTS